MTKTKLAQIWAQLEKLNLVDQFMEDNPLFELLGGDDSATNEDGVKNSPEIQAELIEWLETNGVTV